jgi:acyl carrier protein
MSVETIQAQLLQFVNHEILGGGTVGPDDEVVLDGTVDSLGVARLLGFIETEFSIRVPPEDVTIENFRTIATMAGFLYQEDGTETAQ